MRAQAEGVRQWELLKDSTAGPQAADEKVDLLPASLARLSAKDRETLVLFYVEETSRNEDHRRDLHRLRNPCACNVYLAASVTPSVLVSRITQSEPRP